MRPTDAELETLLRECAEWFGDEARVHRENERGSKGRADELHGDPAYLNAARESAHEAVKLETQTNLCLSAADALASSGAPAGTATDSVIDLMWLVTLRQEHVDAGGGMEVRCAKCQWTMPCPTLRLCDAYEAAIRRAAPPRSPAPPSGEAWQHDAAVRIARENVYEAFRNLLLEPDRQADATEALTAYGAAVAASVQQGEQPT